MTRIDAESGRAAIISSAGHRIDDKAALCDIALDRLDFMGAADRTHCSSPIGWTSLRHREKSLAPGSSQHFECGTTRWVRAGFSERAVRYVVRCARRDGGGSIVTDFWDAIAGGLSSEEAAAVAGVAFAVGTRWFREGGSKPTVTRPR